MWHDPDDQIIGYRMAEMELLIASSRNIAKYYHCSTAVFDAHSFLLRLSEIYPFADKFDLSPRLKQNGEGKNRMKIQMILFGYNTKVYLQQSCIYFPI